jgi:putative transposase
VIVSMSEVAGAAKEGLLALAVGTGLQVMAAMFAEDVARLCGPDGKHNPERAGDRHGTEAGVGHPRRAPAAGDAAPGAGRGWVRL